MLDDVLHPDAAAFDGAALNAALAHYREHGYARLGRVASDATLDALRKRADAIMLGETRYDGLFFQEDAESGEYDDLTFGRGYRGPNLTYRKLEKLELDPLYRAWLEHPFFERIARAVLGDSVALYRAILMTKGAPGGTALPWHQDGGSFWGLDREPELQIWTALDDAPVEAGCVEVVPRSHRAGLVSPLGGVVQPNRVAERNAEADALALPAVAGEVILIHNHLWHRSGRNHTGRTRRAFSVCYLHGETRCLRKKRAPRVFVRLFER